MINLITIHIITLVNSNQDGVFNINSGDAGIFTSAYDGRGRGTVLKKISSTIGDMYEVMLDGTEFIITVRTEQLIQFETESETESENKSTSTHRAQSQLKLQQKRDLLKSNLMIYQTW